MQLKNFRLNLTDLNQKDFAEKAKINYETYKLYERNKRKPPLEVLIKLADFYNVTLDYLVGREFVGGQQINKEEYELIEIFRKLKEEEQARLMGYAKFQISSEENLKSNTKERSSYGK